MNQLGDASTLGSPPRDRGSVAEVFRVFLRLGLTSFGGPIAHLGYFRDELIARRGWISESAFAEWVALCQFLPGPSSSQVGFALGLSRAGWLGGLAAWCGFTLPSAALLVSFAYGASALNNRWSAGLIHGLQLVAVAIVAQAVWGMARALCPDRQRAAIATVAATLVLASPGSLSQLAAIAMGAIGGLLFCRTAESAPALAIGFHPSRRAAIFCLSGFAALLILPRLLEQAYQVPALALFNSFYGSGALVFGGGHVVLPLLRDAVVNRGWVSADTFLAGYGAAQAVPGPLFTFAAFLGTAATPVRGIAGGCIALVAIFLPGGLILAGALPFWNLLRLKPWAPEGMRGINAAVVGLLAAALFDPVWTTAVHGHTDFGIALALFVLLTAWKTPPLLVVLLGAVCGCAAGLFAV